MTFISFRENRLGARKRHTPIYNTSRPHAAARTTYYIDTIILWMLILLVLINPSLWRHCVKVHLATLSYLNAHTDTQLDGARLAI